MEWITHRQPVPEDTLHLDPNINELVWTSFKGVVYLENWYNIPFGAPWQPVMVPEPYVKPTANEIIADAIDILKKKNTELQ